MSKQTAAAHDPAHDEHRPNVKLYIGVFAALLFFTGLTVAVSRLHLPRPQAIALGLTIAGIKAALVAAVFMHLWGEKKLIPKILIGVAIFAVTLVVIDVLDGMWLTPQDTSRMAVADQHPDESAAEPAAPAKPTAAAPEAK